MVLSLRQLRKNSPYTIKQVAEHMGVQVRAISAWESGERAISVVNLYKLLAFYDTDYKISELDKVVPALELSAK